jgi:NADP-dependent 3-hydroxy acid dehydrogenase YdfG
MRVIVTGASKGIGRGIAEVLAEDGHTVGLLARSEAILAQLKSSIEAGGGKADSAVVDLRDVQATTLAIDELAQKWSGLDALVNNAGVVIRERADAISLDDWHAMVETNINGLFYATRAALPHLKSAGGGHIVNISSISGYLPLPGGSGYAATKYAVTGFGESLFQEVRGDGIKVTTVFPGSVDSESHRHEVDADHSWKVQPREVGRAIGDLLATGPGNVISRLEIRPLGRPPQ